MQTSAQTIAKGITIAFASVLITVGTIVAGCTAAVDTASTIAAVRTAVPVSITDAPSDQVVAASLTLNSIVLTDASEKTASLLAAPLTFEATHLDAVQEPLFTPAIPEDTYTSVALTYSNAQVLYQAVRIDGDACICRVMRGKGVTDSGRSHRVPADRRVVNPGKGDARIESAPERAHPRNLWHLIQMGGIRRCRSVCRRGYLSFRAKTGAECKNSPCQAM
jgi:hypothetical protein